MTEDNERKAFEEWAKGLSFNVERYANLPHISASVWGRYVRLHVHYAWQAWLARAKFAADSVGPRQKEPSTSGSPTDVSSFLASVAYELLARPETMGTTKHAARRFLGGANGGCG